jgi:hypothetical protein
MPKVHWNGGCGVVRNASGAPVEVVVAGGEDGDGDYFDYVHIYHIESGRWRHGN